MTDMAVTTFLTEVEKHLKQGDATEHTYRPALQHLFDTLLAPATATNEPKHAIYGAPDFVIQQGSAPIGHVEAKDVGVDLAKIIADSAKDKPLTDNGRQLRRYRTALPNLLYTDGLEWHWFVGGAARLDPPLHVATWDKAKKRLIMSSSGTADLTKLLQQFAAQLKAPPDLGDGQRLMDPVPGIGAVTTQNLLAELYDLANDPAAKAAAADAGLTPATDASGRARRRCRRLSNVGKAGIRGALDWRARTVLTHAPEFKQYAARLAARPTLRRDSGSSNAQIDPYPVRCGEAQDPL